MYYKNKKISKRKDGRLMIRFTKDHKRICIYAKSKTELIKKYKEALNGNISNNSITLKDWIKQWFILYKLDKSENTQILIKSIIKYISKDKIYNMHINNIKVLDINLFLNTINKTKMKELILILKS